MLPFKVDRYFVDETVNSLLRRTAEANFVDSAARLLGQLQIKYRAKYSDGEIQAIADLLELDKGTLEKLNATVTIPSLADERFFRRKDVPVCTECLADQPYIRQCWHHSLNTACTLHGAYLIDTCPGCGGVLEMNRVNAGFCTCGFDIRKHEATPADDANLFVSKLLLEPDKHDQRLSLIERDGKVPDNLSEFIVFIARLRRDISLRKNTHVDLNTAQMMNREFYSITDDLEGNFLEIVRQRVQAANAVVKGNFSQLIGAWYREMNIHFDGDAYKAFRFIAYKVIISDAKSSINRMMKQIAGELQGYKTTFTAAEAARVLGSSADKVFSCVRTGSLKGIIYKTYTNEICLVDRADVEARKHEAEGIVDGAELGKILTASRDVRQRLVKSGVLQRLSADQIPLFAKGGYIKEDAESLLALLEANCTNQGTKRPMSFDEINARTFTDQQVSLLYKKIFSGEVKPVSRIAGVKGLAAFQFDGDELTSYFPSTEEKANNLEISVADLTRITPWKYEAINTWIKLGLLKATRKQSGKQRVKVIALADLFDFLSRNVILADVAQRINSRSVWLVKNKAVADVVAVNSFRGILLSTDAMVEALRQKAAKA